MNAVMTTYVPTILICIICHCTVYYKDTLFKAVVTVNLTSLLCLITMFNRLECDIFDKQSTLRSFVLHIEFREKKNKFKRGQLRSDAFESQ